MNVIKVKVFRHEQSVVTIKLIKLIGAAEHKRYVIVVDVIYYYESAKMNYLKTEEMTNYGEAKSLFEQIKQIIAIQYVEFLMDRIIETID